MRICSGYWRISLHRSRRRNVYLCATSTIIAFLVFQNWNFSKENSQRGEIIVSLESVMLSQRGLSSASKHNVKSKMYLTNNTKRIIRMLYLTGVSRPLKTGKLGVVNVHLWLELCGTNILTMKKFPCFPNIPSLRTVSSGMDMKNLGENYGKRVFGLLIPPQNAEFISFRLTASGSAEFWLSTNDNPAYCECVACSNTTITTSRRVQLNNTKLHYFEILHKHGASQRNDLLLLEWKIDNGSYSTIPATNLKGYQDDQHVHAGAVNFQTFPPMGLRMHGKVDWTNSESLYISRENIYKLPFIPEAITKDLFHECDYTPDYSVKHKLERYASQWEIIYSSVYPPDNTNTTTSTGYKIFGNDILEQGTAVKIVERVLGRFKKKGLRYFSLQSIINIEAKRNRYLVELQLMDGQTKKSMRFSEYLYLPQDGSDLCYPKDYKWNKTAMVNFIVTSGGNQGRWIYHLIRNMEKIYKETLDSNFNIIITDFQSQDLDIIQALQDSSLPNYLFLSNTGHFQKSLGLQQAADSITDPNGIVAILDLHLEVPSYYVDDVRKHTVRGFQVYSPILERMECGTNAAVNMGSYWEVNGYGLVGVYKQDWDKFGGMNVNEFKNKWGGEDVEMMDRILMVGLEADRKKVKGLTHYYHSKRGMWQKILQ